LNLEKLKTKFVLPKEPVGEDWDDFITSSLREAPGYVYEKPKESSKLDQNEAPVDWPDALKDQTLQALKQESWNKYPQAYDQDIVEILSQYLKIPFENILVGPGSNYLISLVLSSFNRHTQMVIARPSFPLYELHNKYLDRPYEVWPLNEDLQYDVSLLPKLQNPSVVVFASPNNPCGNVLKKHDLSGLLQKYPHTYFVADEAYFEFSEEPYTDLLESYSNLIIIRTLSKALSAAAIRVGYILASQKYIREVKKLTLPYLLTPFSKHAVCQLLGTELGRNHVKSKVGFVIKEREKLYTRLKELSNKIPFKVYPSSANFLLIKFPTLSHLETFEKSLKKLDLAGRRMPHTPHLSFSVRISIGLEKSGENVLKAMIEAFPNGLKNH
jgi:histidinol-phosphate aminotransferase